MQPDLYTPYILAAYGAALLILGGLAAYILAGFFRARSQTKGRK
jgi:hypothetical protein